MTAPQDISAKAHATHRPTVAAVAALTVIGLLWAAITWGPHLARDFIASELASWIGRDVRIGGIEIQPLRHRILVKDFRIAGDVTPDEPLLVVPEASAVVDLSAALAGRVHLREVLVRSPTANFARVAAETFSFQDILDRVGGSADDGGAPLSFVLEEAKIEGGKLRVRDEVAETVLQVLRLQVRLANLSNQPDRPDRLLSGEASFGIQDALVEMTFEGAPLAEPAVLETHVRLSGLLLENLAPYLPLSDAVRVSGRLSGTANLTHGTGGWKMADGSVDLIEAALQAGTQQVAAINSMVIEGIRLEVERKRAAARGLRIDGAQIQLSRDRQGQLQFAGLNFGIVPNRPQPAAAVAAAASDDTEQPAWRYSLESVDLDNVEVAYIDMTLPPERRLPNVSIDLHAENVSSDLSRAVPFHASASMEGDSQLSLQGSLRPLPFNLVGSVEVNGFDVTPFEPYFGLLPNLSLVSGEVWGKGDLEIAADAQSALTGISYRGELSVNDVRAFDDVLETDFVRWSALVASVVMVEWHPPAVGRTSIEMGDVAFVDFFGKAVLDEKGRLNLKHVLDQSPDEPGSGRAAVASDAEGSEQQDFSVRLGTVRIASGHINFTDNFVEPNYSVDLTQLAGSITGVASDQLDPASVSIRGLVNGEAPLEIEGEINLLTPQPMVNLRATASGIELTQLSPYAVRWAGYIIKSGTLSAELRYRVEGRRLEGDNRFVLHQLELGERVQGAAAPNLPLRLALSLLRDRQGNVALNLPISGSLADPEFSFPGLLSRALAGLMRKVATAPFSLLASIVGPRAAGEVADQAAGEGLDHIRFPEGSAAIGPDQHRKLEELAAVLEERPAVGLQIIGYADRTADRRALRQVRLESALQLRSSRAGSSPDVEPAMPDVHGHAWRERLLALYRDWVGPGVSSGGLSTEDLEKLLLERIDVSEADLLILARRRGVGVVEALVEAGLNSERIDLLAPQFAAVNAEFPGSRAHIAIAEREQAQAAPAPL
jgi:hypothetical protein